METISSVQFFAILTNPDVMRHSAAPHGQPFASHDVIEQTGSSRTVSLLGKSFCIADNAETLPKTSESEKRTAEIIAELTKA